MVVLVYNLSQNTINDVLNAIIESESMKCMSKHKCGDVDLQNN
jgi:hypothetical protein